MGICSSCESTQVETVKLILQDGRLQEFSYTVKVSYLLSAKSVNPTTHFICSADEMEFDGVVTAMNGDEVLQLGQLYFALPLTRLKRPLPAEEMAALAVKASSALMKSGGEKCGCRKKLVFPEGEKGGVNGRRVASGGGGRRRGSKFSAMLGAIPE